MKKLAATICLTSALVMGFTTASLSQLFEAGKSYTYQQELPDTDAVQRLAIKIGKDGKTYQTTIFSGKYKYTCAKGKILSGNKLERVACENVKESDVYEIVPTDYRYISPYHLVTGSLKEPTRIIEVFTEGHTSGADLGQEERNFYFSLEKPSKRGFQPTSPVVKVKPKGKRTPPRVKKDPLSQKLVTLKTLLKGGLITQKEYNTKRAVILKEISGGKVNPIVRKLKQIQKLLDQKLITPADATYKRRQILDGM